eukprot:31340-Pelagococcus_subviridis.AAC.8
MTERARALPAALSADDDDLRERLPHGREVRAVRGVDVIPRERARFLVRSRRAGEGEGERRRRRRRRSLRFRFVRRAREEEEARRGAEAGDAATGEAIASRRAPGACSRA